MIWPTSSNGYPFWVDLFLIHLYHSLMRAGQLVQIIDLLLIYVAQLYTSRFLLYHSHSLQTHTWVDGTRLKDREMGWFQGDFSRKGHMSRPRNSYQRDIRQITIQICLQKCAIPTDLDFEVFSKKSMFLYFSEPNINHI